MDELRISCVMRYPVAPELAIVKRVLPEAGLHARYSVKFSAIQRRGRSAGLRWTESCRRGSASIRTEGILEGTPTEAAKQRAFTLRATDSAGRRAEHNFTLTVSEAEILSASLPLGFMGTPYRKALQTRHMVRPVSWSTDQGQVAERDLLEPGEWRANRQPQGSRAREDTTRGHRCRRPKSVTGVRAEVVSEELRHIAPDENTIALWDWQGPSGRYIPDLKGDAELTLTWVNTKGDTRLPRPGWGIYPHFIGGGEGGFVGPQWNDKVDLRTAESEWTVEAWVRRGGSTDGYFREFHFGHICGTYDNTERGVWELYLSDQDSPDGSMAPGVHFLGAEPEQALKDLHPYSRPEGTVAGSGMGGNPRHRLAPCRLAVRLRGRPPPTLPGRQTDLGNEEPGGPQAGQ